MTLRPTARRSFLLALVVTLVAPACLAEEAKTSKRLLYVAVPGVRNYLEYGGHGLLVYDIDAGHKLLKRIPAAGLDPSTGKPSNVKGVCASAATGRIYISTLKTLTCIDLVSEEVLWEKPYEGGCDRMSMTPDGKLMYLPSLEGPHWHVVDGDGKVLDKIVPDSGAHNTVVGLDGRFAYLAGLKSPILRVVDTSTQKVVKDVGPFGAPVRPFTVNGGQTRAYVNVNELLGFEVGDLQTGKALHRVEVKGYKKGPVKRHGCPSHGIGLTPDEKEIWLCDAHNQSLHVFDNTATPPAQAKTIKLRDEPGWVTFTTDGQYAYPSTGEVIEAKTKRIVAALSDEQGRPVMSEKMVQIDVGPDGRPVANGDQFGLGRVTREVGQARSAAR